jgi:hypothetical protein
MGSDPVASIFIGSEFSEVVQRENDIQLAVVCRRDDGELIAPPDGSDGSDVKTLLDQGGG